jgi:hypothetical protein
MKHDHDGKRPSAHIPTGEEHMADRAAIHFECRALAHIALPSRRGSGGLTVHNRAWAYCDGDGADAAHDWVASGGVPIDLLIRWNRPAAAARGPGAQENRSAPPRPARKRA